ncbi:unnamed protein product [Rangifer tarandus platyrhynchus]|uniref:Uncharacterized protein n=2 Tax=Rangifer tarandus platyrhynchus TaxID=3082113 RepID=A0ACB0EQU5_RANTA|nr:unnamed protein product [Rangifer tarandus platyrhynchus]CAI9702411.1 unnamed protein product [Rangifer tarandus platyrhynchus]
MERGSAATRGAPHQRPWTQGIHGRQTSLRKRKTCKRGFHERTTSARRRRWREKARVARAGVTGSGVPSVLRIDPAARAPSPPRAHPVQLSHGQGGLLRAGAWAPGRPGGQAPGAALSRTDHGGGRRHRRASSLVSRRPWTPLKPAGRHLEQNSCKFIGSDPILLM